MISNGYTSFVNPQRFPVIINFPVLLLLYTAIEHIPVKPEKEWRMYPVSPSPSSPESIDNIFN